MYALLIGVLPPWLAALVWLVIGAVGAMLATLWRHVRTDATADDRQLGELLTRFHDRLNDVDQRLGDVEADLYNDTQGEDDEWS